MWNILYGVLIVFGIFFLLWCALVIAFMSTTSKNLRREIEKTKRARRDEYV